MRKATGNPNIFAPIELEKKGARQMFTVTLTRPIRMLAFEAIVLFTCLYLALAYAIFYMFFQAYPIIFQGDSQSSFVSTIYADRAQVFTV